MDEDFDLFEIDETNLFGEWKYQSPRVRQTADKHAAALKKMRELQAKQKVIEAEQKSALRYVEAILAKKIRKNPEEYGFDKKAPTEGAIDEIVRTSQKFRDQEKSSLQLILDGEKEIIEAQFEADIYSGWLRALENKKKGLEKTTEMILSGLKAEPRLPKDIDVVQIARLERAAGKPKGGTSRDEVLGRKPKKEK